jgi:hypothetical protein
MACWLAISKTFENVHRGRRQVGISRNLGLAVILADDPLAATTALRTCHSCKSTSVGRLARLAQLTNNRAVGKVVNISPSVCGLRLASVSGLRNRLFCFS